MTHSLFILWRQINEFAPLAKGELSVLIHNRTISAAARTNNNPADSIIEIGAKGRLGYTTVLAPPFLRALPVTKRA
jgi:hypothetical protein